MKTPRLILWAVLMAIGTLFIHRAQGQTYSPTVYLIGVEEVDATGDDG